MGGIADSLSLMKSEVYEFVNQFEEHKHKVVMVSRGETRPSWFPQFSFHSNLASHTFENTHWRGGPIFPHFPFCKLSPKIVIFHHSNMMFTATKTKLMIFKIYGDTFKHWDVPKNIHNMSNSSIIISLIKYSKTIPNPFGSDSTSHASQCHGKKHIQW